MKIEEFIATYKAQLVAYILKKCCNCSVSDEDIAEQIMNDEGLYAWAVSEGVDI